MADGKPSILSWMRLIYRDSYRAWRAMPQLVLTMFLIGVTLSLAVLVVFGRRSPLAALVPGRPLIEFAVNFGWLFLLMPFVIAVHRFVLLDEVTPRYAIEPQLRRVLRFFGSWLVLSVVAAIPLLWLIALVAAPALPSTWILVSIALGLGAVPILLCLRMSILFPAIAVDAPGANWSNAFRDTKGHAWGIFLLFLTAFTVFIAAGVVLTLVAWIVAILSALVLAIALPFGAVMIAVVTAVQLSIFHGVALMSVTVFAATASRLYQLLGHHVNQPPAVPHAA